VVSGQLLSPATLPPRDDPMCVPIRQELGSPRAGLDDVERGKIMPLQGLKLRHLRRLASSESRYRLSYHGGCFPVHMGENVIQDNGFLESN
jgi:hypothetical protein